MEIVQLDAFREQFIQAVNKKRTTTFKRWTILAGNIHDTLLSEIEHNLFYQPVASEIDVTFYLPGPQQTSQWLTAQGQSSGFIIEND